jgi:hypothetical protein
MALFGGIGKKLGLGSAKDVFGEGIGSLVQGVGDTINEALPTIGAAVGYAYGGPAFAALGSGLGTAAQGGRSTKDILVNAALAYGAGKVAPSFGIESQGANFGQEGIGSFLPDVSGFKLNPFSDPLDPSPFAKGGADTPITDLTKTGGGGIMDSLAGISLGDAALGAAAGLGLGALMGGGQPEDDDTPERPYPKGEAFGTVQDQEGNVYSIADPEQMAEYNKMMRQYQRPGFEYDLSSVIRAKHGGSFDELVDGEVKGPGTGTSDSVPAKLSDGEFVLTAKAVRGAGAGDRDIGAARLYDMMADLEATA